MRIRDRPGARGLQSGVRAVSRWAIGFPALASPRSKDALHIVLSRVLRHGFRMIRVIITHARWQLKSRFSESCSLSNGFLMSFIPSMRHSN